MRVLSARKYLLLYLCKSRYDGASNSQMQPVLLSKSAYIRVKWLLRFKGRKMMIDDMRMLCGLTSQAEAPCIGMS